MQIARIHNAVPDQSLSKAVFFLSFEIALPVLALVFGLLTAAVCLFSEILQGKNGGVCERDLPAFLEPFRLRKKNVKVKIFRNSAQ